MPNFVTPMGVALYFYNNQQRDLALDALIASGLVASAYAVRKLWSGYEEYCLRLRRSSDNAEMDFGFTASGDLDIAAILTWLGAANGFISALYDQTGNAHTLTAAATDNQPKLIANVLNGHPVWRFDGTDDYLRNTSFVDFGDTYTALMVHAFAAAGDTGQGVFEVTNGATNTGFSHSIFTTTRWSGRDASIIRNVSSVGLQDDVFRIHTGDNSGTQMEYWQNQVSIGTVAYTAPNPNTLNRLDVGRMLSPAGAYFHGDMAELIIVNTQLTPTQRNTLEDNQNDYYNVF